MSFKRGMNSCSYKAARDLRFCSSLFSVQPTAIETVGGGGGGNREDARRYSRGCWGKTRGGQRTGVI